MIRSRAIATGALGALATLTCCKKSEPQLAQQRSEAHGKDTAQNSMPKNMPMPAGGESAKPASDMPAASVTLSSAQVQHGGVTWKAVTVGTASGTAVLPGELVPNEDHTARLGAPARGRVLTVSVRPGDRVVAGQTLVTMQSTEAGMAQSDVSKADAELTARRAEAQYASSARARAERLLAIKAIPRQDYERAVSDDERANAAVAQAQAEARRAHATARQLSASRNSNGEVVLRAPLAGVVLARTAAPGAVVEAGAPLVMITDASTLWLSINAPEQLSALFERNGHLRFIVPAFPADTFPARIDAVGAGLEPETRTLSVRALVNNNSGRLKPHMLATAIVDGARKQSAVFVPEDAVQMMQGKWYAFLARPDGKGGATFQRREVSVGARNSGQVSVLRGLVSGDVVAVTGAFAVKAEFQKGTMPKMEM